MGTSLRALALVSALALAAPAAADTITVNLSSAAGGQPIAGTAAAVGSAGSGADTAGASGAATITVPAGADYAVTAYAPGFKAFRVTGVASGAIVSAPLTASANKFTALPVFGGANGGLYADGQPGTFYAQSTQIPQLYRTTDWGGTWQPVTAAFDDAVNGLIGTSNIGRDMSATTSGYPGEIAAFVSGDVYYSTDFGVTWKKVNGTPSSADSGQPFPRLSWGHAGGTSVLVDTINDHQYLADMTSATPTFAQMTTDYARAADGEAMAIGNGTDKPYVAVADNSGDVNVYALTASGTPGSAVAGPVSGFPHGANGVPLAVAFGGASPASGPPSGIIVADANQIGMTVKTPAAASYDAPTLVSNSSCATQNGSDLASIAPDTGASSGVGAGNVNGCWVRLTAGPPTLTATSTGWVDFAIDSGWGQTIGGNVDHVSFQGGTRGPVKSSALNGSGAPTFDANVSASAGTGAATGGVSVDGITAPTVEGQTFGPTAPAQQATVLHGGFGGVGYASSDGGATVKVASGVGGWAVDWFAGASGSWLVYGTPANSAHVLTAFENWTPATPAASSPNVAGAQSSDNSLLLSGSGMTSSEVFATALAGAPGTDLVFVGLSDSNGFDGNADGVVRRLRLNPGSPDPTASDVTRIGAGQITKAIHALAYCPADGSAASMQDVLMVATGNTAQGGGLWRVTGATGPSPTATQIDTVPTAAMVFKVRADCAAGTVWAGTNGGGGTSLYKSTDGGQSFAGVTLPRNGQVQAIGVNQANPDELLIGLDRDGTIMRTLDGGLTWTVENDPGFDHNFSGDGIADLLIPPPATAASSLRRGLRFAGRSFGGLTSKDVLVAGAGVYSARLRTTAPAGGGGSGGTPASTTGKGGGSTTVDRTPPTLRAVTLTHVRFRVSRRATAVSAGRRAPVGTTFRFSVSESSTVVIAIAKAVRGYESGRRCVAKRPHGAHRPRRCTRFVAVGRLTRHRLSGAASVAFSGRIGTRALTPGRYRASVTATDAAGNRSAARTAAFTIVR